MLKQKQNHQKVVSKLSLFVLMTALIWPVLSAEKIEGEVWKPSRPTQTISYNQMYVIEPKHKNYKAHSDVGLYSELSDDEEDDCQSVITREPNRVVITFTPVPTREKEKIESKTGSPTSRESTEGISQNSNEKPLSLHSSSDKTETKSQYENPIKKEDINKRKRDSKEEKEQDSDSEDEDKPAIKKHKGGQEHKKKGNDEGSIAPVKMAGPQAADIDSKTLSKSSSPVAEIVIYNKDNRQKVPNPICLTYPWCVHGHMKMKFKPITSKKKISYIGSGTMIGEKFVVTAGHNLFFRDNTPDDKAHRKHWQPYPYKILFYPGMDGSKGVKPLKAAAKKAFIASEWENLNLEKEKADQFDIGLLILDRELGHQTGWYGGYIANNNDLETLNLNITGYPGDLPKKHDLPHSRYAGKVMYTASGNIQNFSPSPNEHHIYYSIATAGGQSGSALWT